MAESWHWYVYIIECKNGKYYTGCTWNVAQRYEEHLSGLGSKYTSRYGVKRIVYYEEHDDLEAARYRERQIKGWNQTKKKKLISVKWGPEW